MINHKRTVTVMYSQIDDSFEIKKDNAQNTACGRGSSFCRNSIDSSYQTRFKSDECSIQTSADANEKLSNYVMWLPDYKKKTCEGSGFHNCDLNRFGSGEVSRESFLQGRGQTSAGRGCFASGLRFLPKDKFPETKPKNSFQANPLFAQNTKSKRSCGSLAEMDMTVRLRPLPGTFNEAFVPFILSKDSLVPNLTDRLVPEGTTLSNKSYPSWDEIKTRQNKYR
jgi:hypothetical protein